MFEINKSLNLAGFGVLPSTKNEVLS
jgi:hypothetical protein